MINVARYDKGYIRGENAITPEGFIKARAIVTRCGVFLYKNGDGTVRKELRHPDDVLQQDSLASIKLIPVVDGHPAERLINSDNAKKLAIGYTGECVDIEQPYILANMVITDENAVEKIKSKEKNELSLGYTVDLVDESGFYFGEPYDCRQTNIRYNHLALVDQARAGPEARIALDGLDAVEIRTEESEVAKKRVKVDLSRRRVKIDNEEYEMDNEELRELEDLMRQHERLEKELAESRMALDKVLAERDSLRDKDHHNPAMEHQEKDEIGPHGKEEKDPIDLYGMQSHVRDYERPEHMKTHAVNGPHGNRHYPEDLPHIAKVDAAEINMRVKERVKLEKLAEKYLDRTTLNRLDSLSDMEIKNRLIMSLQPNARLDGKSDTYVNARFDAACEEIPGAKVIASASTYIKEDDADRDQADAQAARKRMINNQKSAWKRK